MLQNAYFLAKIGADTAENEQHFAEILPKTGNYPTGPPANPRAGGIKTRRAVPRASRKTPIRAEFRSAPSEQLLFLALARRPKTYRKEENKCLIM